jgi:stage II sporulation protein D
MPRLSSQLRGRPLGWIAAATLLAIAACVSLTPPKGGTGNIPVVTGGYKSGANQLVRIALDGSVPNSRLSATGEWTLFFPGISSPAARLSQGQELTVSRNGATLTLSPQSDLRTAPAQVIARPLGEGSFVTWNGKRYRGDLSISATDTGLLVVNQLPMDSYLRGVVPLEIGNRTAAEMAAVQAQAVAARTYAYKHLTAARAFDMYSTVQDQVYGGVDAEKPQSDEAITSTADVVVLYNGQPITTPYHSTCGGSTAAVSEVWYDQPDQPYLRPVSDRIPGTSHFYCDPSPRFSWTQSYDGAGLRAVMEKYLAAYTNAPKANLGKITGVRTQGKTQSGRIAALIIQTESGTYTLKGNDIRFVLRDPKGTILNSTFFDYTASTNGGEVSNLTINGRGYGHGIGMCQWGAIGRARAGQDYRTILGTYYPGTAIGRIAG